MKKETFLKILKYFGVACIGAFVGMGALIGVSSCSSKSDKQLETRQVVKHNKKVDLSTEVFSSDKLYYFVAKNYATNGKNVFYQDSISVENSRIMSSSKSGLQAVDFTLIHGGENTKYYLNIDTTLNGGVYKLTYVILSNSFNTETQNYYEPNWRYLYHAFEGTFNRNYCAFIGKGPFNVVQGNRTTCISYINQLFDIYELGNQSFKFSQQINYYAPYGQDIDSYYVNDADMVNPGDYTLKNLVENKPFYSGGLAFDTIRLRYVNAMASSYVDDNGNRKVWLNSGFATFWFVEYVNSATNYILVVNDRILSPWQDGNQSGMNLTKGSKWVSDYYRDITFFEDVSQVLITNISILNNSSFEGGYFDHSSYNNVGLSNVFDLLRLAFSSWIPIFNIQIIPGITIGLMMFLPLITGIILFIVWLVKR